MTKQVRPPRKSTAPGPTSPRAVESEVAGRSGQRLQRVLAAAGYGSRRACEQFILDGRVEVDGVCVRELGTRVDPSKQVVRVDGVVLKRPRKKYFVVHKPPGVVSTKRDPAGRTRVTDLVPHGALYFTVGRLDRSSEGLILITNDGDLAQRLAHPRYGVERVYQVEVAGTPSREALRQLRSGIHLAEAKVRASAIRVLKHFPRSTLLEMVLHEGRNREIRRMAARIGHKVLRLRRIAMGPIRLGDLPRGAYRELTPAELARLRKLLGSSPESRLRAPRPTIPAAAPLRSVPRPNRRQPGRPRQGTPAKRRRRRGGIP